MMRKKEPVALSNVYARSDVFTLPDSARKNAKRRQRSPATPMKVNKTMREKECGGYKNFLLANA